MEQDKRHEMRFEGGYKEQLAQAFELLFPEAVRESTLEECRVAKVEVSKRERVVTDQDINDSAREYGADISGIKGEQQCIRIEHGESDKEHEVDYDQVFSLPVRNHFSEERLPRGYGYKGGAARALLLRSLGIDPTYVPRDLDLVRMGWESDSDELDVQVSEQFMPEDFEHGDGVEVLESRDSYLTTRDFRLNEILATDDSIIVTKGALLDIMRHIIRPTQYEKYGWNEYGELGPKMLAKILRFYSEAMYRYDEAGIEDVEDWQFEQSFISPFWLALQLDRACDVNIEVAQKYVDELISRGQLPPETKTVEDAASYLIELVSDFYYRHAQTKQFEMEDHWAQVDENRKKVRRGQVRKMREGVDSKDRQKEKLIEPGSRNVV